MRRLFWRIFALFWAANVILIIAIAWITSNKFENEKIPGLEITRMDSLLNEQLRSAARALRQGHLEGLRAHLQNTLGYGGVSVFVLDANNRDLLGREVPDAIIDAAAHPIQDPQGLHANRTRLRRLADGDTNYTAVARFEGPPLLRMLYRRPNTFWLHVAVALVISAAFSLLLAAFITAPLARIRASAHRVARGDLSARVGELRFGRSSEILALAHEFDQMAERLKELVDGQRRLIRDVSHEMRSPLARLRVALELARAQVLQAPSAAPPRAGASSDAAHTAARAQADGVDAGRGFPSGDACMQLDRIEREAQRLEEMIAQAIQLSRMETTVASKVERVALDEMLADIASDAAFEAQVRPCTLHVAQTAPLHVQAESDLLASAIENVVRNAVTYTAPNSTVDLCLDRVDNLARLRVRDRGPGVPPGDCARIFEPYFRTDAARPRNSGGSGLGLAIAKRAVERQGGRIRAGNLDGGGLEVEILLPLA